MNVTAYMFNGHIHLRVVPNSSRLKLIEDKGQLKLYLTKPAADHQANDQLIKFFKKQLKLTVRIVSGLNSRDKVLEIINSSKPPA